VIVVAGEALVDLIVRADGSIAPSPGGGPYNAARTIARLGAPVSWLGALSSDRFGRQLEALLATDGVSLGLVQRTDAPTTLALAELDGSGNAAYRFYTEGTAAPAVIAPPIGGRLPEGTRALHVGTLGLVLEPMATTLEGIVGGLPDDVLLFVDPNCRPSVIGDAERYRARMARVLRRADVVRASVDDLAFLRPGDDAPTAASWIASVGARVVLVTDGARPVRVWSGGGVRVLAVPGVAVVDTVGAGDSFGGAALAWLVHEAVGRASLDLDTAVRAARFGIRAAGIASGRAGAEPPTLAELGGWTA